MKANRLPRQNEILFYFREKFIPLRRHSGRKNFYRRKSRPRGPIDISVSTTLLRLKFLFKMPSHRSLKLHFHYRTCSGRKIYFQISVIEQPSPSATNTYLVDVIYALHKGAFHYLLGHFEFLVENYVNKLCLIWAEIRC